MAFLGHYIKIS